MWMTSIAPINNATYRNRVATNISNKTVNKKMSLHDFVFLEFHLTDWSIHPSLMFNMTS